MTSVSKTGSTINSTTVTATLAPNVPAGVTLQPIDGGPNYYQSNGFTYAYNAGWDNPNFFPIGLWLAPILTQSDASRWVDLDLNTMFGMTSNTLLSLLRSNGIWAVEQQVELTGILATNGSLGSESVGLLSYDEPGTFDQGIYTPLSTTANSLQDGRFWWMNNTDAFLYYGALIGTPSPNTATTDLRYLVTTPNGAQRHIDASSVDIYWFAGAKGGVSAVLGTGGLYDNLGRPMTLDEAARGSNYGDMIDRERAITGGTTPVYAFIEDGGPYLENTSASSYITPPELNWAVWSSLIHGARGVIYFNHTFGGPATSQDNLAQLFYQTVQPGQTISMYDQVLATDALIKQLAPVLDAPFALGYVKVNSGGYTFPVADTTLGGIETMVKDYNGQFYIFADTRDSETQTNISATFTIADTSATSVTVVNEGRSIPVVNGSFTDTFAYAWTVHIYQVNDGPNGTAPTVAITNAGGQTTQLVQMVSGTVDPSNAGTTVTLFDGVTQIGTAKVQADGDWKIAATLSLGSHTLMAQDTDVAGTVGTSNLITYTVNPSGPSEGLLDSLQPSDKVAAIYIGYFDRAADAGGSAFWENQFGAATTASPGPGLSPSQALVGIADSFAHQLETIALYPFLASGPINPSSQASIDGVESLVSNVYVNLFNRNVDAGSDPGAQYWVHAILNGQIALGEAVLDIANGAIGVDAQVLLNKIVVSDYFVSATPAAVGPVPAMLLAEAHSILIGVGADAASVAVAEAHIDAFFRA